MAQKSTIWGALLLAVVLLGGAPLAVGAGDVKSQSVYQYPPCDLTDHFFRWFNPTTQTIYIKRYQTFLGPQVVNAHYVTKGDGFTQVPGPLNTPVNTLGWAAWNYADYQAYEVVFAPDYVTLQPGEWLTLHHVCTGGPYPAAFEITTFWYTVGAP